MSFEKSSRRPTAGDVEVPEYTAQRLKEALAHDERVAELGIQVKVLEGKVFLHGKVPTAQRREIIGAVAARELPGFSVVNEIAVSGTGEIEPEILG